MLEKVKRVTEAYKAEGDIVLSRVAIHLMHRYFHGVVASDEELRARFDLPNYRKVLADFRKHADGDQGYAFTIDGLVEDLADSDESLTAGEFYEFLCKKLGINIPKFQATGSMDEECYFMALLHLPLFDDNRYSTKTEPEHTRSRLFDF